MVANADIRFSEILICCTVFLGLAMKLKERIPLQRFLKGQALILREKLQHDLSGPLCGPLQALPSRQAPTRLSLTTSNLQRRGL